MISKENSDSDNLGKTPTKKKYAIHCIRKILVICILGLWSMKNARIASKYLSLYNHTEGQELSINDLPVVRDKYPYTHHHYGQSNISKAIATTSQMTSMDSNYESSHDDDFKEKNNNNKTVIAYAVSITDCQEQSQWKLMDGAAVLHQSIRLASHQSTKYTYHMIAFLHPSATLSSASSCETKLKQLGYEVQIRDTPFNETEIQNQHLIKAQSNSCCGAKEYLKLYSYVLMDYPVVVHLDLDCLVLKPMDDVFDLMLEPSFDRNQIPIMWNESSQDIPQQVDFVFVRDYGMVKPGKRQPHQIGVQGGFLVIRPNQTDFQKMIDLILSGSNFQSGIGWGGKEKAYGGYYGSGTIQGLASYYYGEFAKDRAVELNRCYYNQMVDSPYGKLDQSKCKTLEDTCQDCRETELNDIYTAHFTNCGKPYLCTIPTDWWLKMEGAEKQHQLCMELFREWHSVRLSLEHEWGENFEMYQPKYASPQDTTTEIGYYLNFYQGHCSGPGKYIHIQYPDVDGPLISKEFIETLDENQDSPQQNSYTRTKSESTIGEREVSIVPSQGPKKVKIAFAISVTKCEKEVRSLLDGAAVLQHSIHLASEKSKYEYETIAFLHREAETCESMLEALNFKVQIVDTPFNETLIPNPHLIQAQGNSCCGSKEYIKLYSYMQLQYPVVVHLDMDCLVLKPLDDLFDLMLDPSFDRSKIASMWLKTDEFPNQVDFLFTRDYNMVDPPRKQPHQIGVQGGFLVVRPNATDYQNFIDIILSGGDFKGFNWGGKLGYGGYYGAGTIQGLAAYYYGEFAKERAVELNRCYYDAMVDSPMGKDVHTEEERCRTLEQDCQDCRRTNVSEVYTSHFTVCGKPWACRKHAPGLCMDLHREWHNVRRDLQMKWINEFPDHASQLPMNFLDERTDSREAHCGQKNRYSPLLFPRTLNISML